MAFRPERREHRPSAVAGFPPENPREIDAIQIMRVRTGRWWASGSFMNNSILCPLIRGNSVHPSHPHHPVTLLHHSKTNSDR
jgi:hypothetical protein